jgi:hypothetical protein
MIHFCLQGANFRYHPKPYGRRAEALGSSGESSNKCVACQQSRKAAISLMELGAFGGRSACGGQPIRQSREAI